MGKEGERGREREGGRERERERKRGGPVSEFLGESKVGDFQVAVAVQEKVLRFQVAVDDVLRVQVIQGAHDLARVEITCGYTTTSQSIIEPIHNGCMVEAPASLRIHLHGNRQYAK